MQRFYANPYSDSTVFDYSTIKSGIRSYLDKATVELYNSLQVVSSHDLSLYTGLAGIVITLQRISNEYLKSFPRVDISTITVPPLDGVGFCSNISWAMLKYSESGKRFSLDSSMYQDCQCDEMLYGRAGLLIQLDYFTRKKGLVLEHGLCANVFRTINLNSFPWSWRRKVYYGAAHGTAGILFTLLTMSKDYSESASDSMQYTQMAQQLCEISFLPESGNFKSSSSSSSNDGGKLVQWCHGAPGFVPLLLQCVSPDDECVRSPSSTSDKLEGRYTMNDYLDKALKCIWKRGFLLKGHGICHGLSGNGYAFLAAYLKTSNRAYLQRALAFATEIMEVKNPLDSCRNADEPFSLFNGLAGCIQFLLDVLRIIQMETSEDNEGKEDNYSSFELMDGLRIF